MDCDVCTEPFDAARRRPKVLVPCGHSACLPCLQGLQERRCPECRLIFVSAAEDLPDNIAMIRALESNSRRPRLWCNDCKFVAGSDCLDTHTVKSARATLQEEVVQLQVRAAQLAKKLPEALRQDGDGCPEQAIRVLQLAKQSGTALEVSVRGDGGEALTATWTTPSSAPAGQQSAVQAVATDVLVLALAKRGLWQQPQRGVKRQREREGDEQEETGQDVGNGNRADGERGPEEIPPEWPILEELKVEPDPSNVRKADLLRTVGQHRVRRLARVRCSRHSAWSLELLRLAAPHVEELSVLLALSEHVEAVNAMPRLRRLEVQVDLVRCSYYELPLPPPPAHHVGLRWLSVHNPVANRDGHEDEATFGLARAHAATLEELVLRVGTNYVCLRALLGRCGFARLRRVSLTRRGVSHSMRGCRAQLADLRTATSLPAGLRVQCAACDGPAPAYAAF